MTTEPVIKPEATYTEAPASWNTRYVTQEGFVCQITLRGENGKDLLEKAKTALAFLLEHGYLPDQYQKSNRNQRGDGRLCPIHQCAMRRYEKDGRAWYSHKLDDGSWCRGQAGGRHV